MPKIPDLTVYLEALHERVDGAVLLDIRLASPFVLRSVSPTIEEVKSHRVTGLHRLGKRLVLELEDDLYIVIHLMIAGRLQWKKPAAKMPGRLGLLAFDFDLGTLVLTEAGKKHRASVNLVRGNDNLAGFDRGGIEVAASTFDQFKAALTSENHTLKRSLTDQRFIAGVGNAYSDEILHHARLSPMLQTKRITDEQWHRLWDSTLKVLNKWIALLREESTGKFPDKVTAFHAEMAAHGKYKQPCPDCGNPIQRIRYANNECNYCAKCQNQGNLLADRALSRLLKKDWPKTLEELDSLTSAP